MPRTYGTITTSIWNDPKFSALDQASQLTYFMLATQADISSVGILPLTLRRWSNYSADATQEGLSKALRTLIDGHFVVVDWDREELLIRSFVKWDGGYKNGNRLQAIQATAAAVFSPLLASVLAGELDRLGIKHTIETTPSEGPSKAPPTDMATQSEPPRVVVTQVGTYPNPQPSFQNPQPATPPEKPSSPAPPPTARASDPRPFAAFWEKYPRKAGKLDAEKAFARAVKRVGAPVVMAGLERFVFDPQFTPHPATWLNQGRWDDEPPPAPAAGRRGPPPPQRSTTDDRVAATLALPDFPQDYPRQIGR